MDWSAARRNTDVARQVRVIFGFKSGGSVVDVNTCSKLHEGKGNNSDTKHDGVLQRGMYRVVMRECTVQVNSRMQRQSMDPNNSILLL